MGTNTEFDRWMADVDRHIAGICGFTSMDLPDIAYRDMFEDGNDPSEAGDLALEGAGF